MAVIDGDPGKPAMFTARLKMPDGYKIPPHWHPTDEQVTVLSGTLKAGSGAKWDDASMRPLVAGSYANMRRKQNHYVMAQGETVVQITAMGPFAITYVNAQDDPRKKSSN
jgi:quercetin dioxygenase-like cupin family protein